MDNYKITEKEMNSGVSDEPNILSGTPQENKAVFDYLPRLIAGKVNGFIDAVISKFTDYYNKGEIDSKESVLNEAINTKANDADVYKKTETYTKSEVDSKETALSDRINAKANSADVYAKSETYSRDETNQQINEKITELGAGDMSKAVYDTDGDGVVDKAETAENAVNAEKLNGQAASYYATKTEAQTAQTTADNALSTSVKKTVNIEIAGTDLNDYTEDGIYYFDATYTPTNIPVGVNGWLLVLGSKSGTAKQLWWRLGTLDSNDFHFFVRTYGSGSWSAWTMLITAKGGTFTGNVVAYSTNRSTACLRNALVQNSSASAVSTNYLVFRRK